MDTGQKTRGRSVALMRFLSGVARSADVYIVGGAVRNHVMGLPAKDLDVVIDTVSLGGKRDSEWFAKRVQQAMPVRSSLVTNQYGVAIITVAEPWLLDGFQMEGEVIEVANARKESYGESSGKGYKPHTVQPSTIEDDISRRDFTVNTLLWRLQDVGDGPDGAEVLDLTGRGLQHLEERVLHTPLDPDRTFQDDATRMLRAVRFLAKYNLQISAEVTASIRRNAPALKKMPWDAVRKILVEDILNAPSPRRSIALMKTLGLSDVLKEMLHEEPGFASALGRALTDREAHVLLDILDQGWVVRTPISFLDRSQQLRLREILLEFASDPGFDKVLVDALKKPPIDQQRLFTLYSIPPKERQTVAQIAREGLLQEPSLAGRPESLQALVEREVAARYQRGDSRLAARVVERFKTEGCPGVAGRK